MSRIMGILVLALFGASGHALPQGSPKPLVSREIPNAWTTVELDPRGAELHLTLPDSGKQHWVLGIQVREGAKDRLEIAELRFAPPEGPYGRTGLRRVREIAAYSQGLVTNSRDTVSVAEGGSEHVALVFVQLSAPREVIARNGHGSALRVRAGDSAVIVGGELRGQKFAGRHELPLIAVQGAHTAPTAAPSGPVFRHGAYVADARLMRAHIANYVDFERVHYAGLGPRAFGVRLEIGIDGRVKNVSLPPGEQPALEALVVSAIRQWTFRPFVADAKPVPVVADLLIGISPDGRVSSAVSPAAELR